MQDNDIVLCDGPCRRAFHEQCCVPPFNAADLDEEADWLCPACSAKACPAPLHSVDCQGPLQFGPTRGHRAG